MDIENTDRTGVLIASIDLLENASSPAAAELMTLGNWISVTETHYFGHIPLILGPRHKTTILLADECLAEGPESPKATFNRYHSLITFAQVMGLKGLGMHSKPGSETVLQIMDSGLIILVSGKFCTKKKRTWSTLFLELMLKIQEHKKHKQCQPQTETKKVCGKKGRGNKGKSKRQSSRDKNKPKNRPAG